ncbi:hypothetical protein J3R30DRAFT_3505904 [Lentinula aciculospora]|uniref:Uncharacterized protein n=1 Tax=Lentinula aciculospora TaxID=153920 RepID=A0A9W9A5N3_9AGAR|nr:hypothetical protein J3R30DRAFT_3505904 [Lentinula aciculospora]
MTEVTCILGTWFGNNINADHIWALVLDKIDKNLVRWLANGLTMEGQRHVIQMIIGGMTQYLATVQGMPKDIEKWLMKQVQSTLNFMLTKLNY